MTNDNDATGVTRRRCLPKLRVAIIPIISLRLLYVKWIYFSFFKNSYSAKYYVIANLQIKAYLRHRKDYLLIANIVREKSNIKITCDQV